MFFALDTPGKFFLLSKLTNGLTDRSLRFAVMMCRGREQAILTTRGLLDLLIVCHASQGDLEGIEGDVGQVFCHVKRGEGAGSVLAQDVKELGAQRARFRL